MFIELTDHLRCPRAHPEAFLVLLPEQMAGRRVVAGHLACPVCQWGVTWSDGVPDFGGGWQAHGAPPFDAEAARAMLGIDGPGGWIALAGNGAALAHELAAVLPGVAVVALNAPPAIADAGQVTVVRSGVWPLKAHSIRGAILGADAAAWRDDAIASALPGLRVIGAGEPPNSAHTELLGVTADAWVARAR